MRSGVGPAGVGRPGGPWRGPGAAPIFAAPGRAPGRGAGRPAQVRIRAAGDATASEAGETTSEAVAATSQTYETRPEADGAVEPERGGAGGDASRRWGRLALGTAVLAYLLIVLGGVVRITGSGMGCGPDWPLCNGRLVPLFDLETFIEWSHRMVAALVGLLVAGVAAHAWWPGRGEAFRPWRTLAAAALGLLVVQVLLGAVTVRLELPPWTVILHLGTAMALLGVLVAGAARALADPRRPARDRAARVGWWTAAAGFGVVLLGALVANLGAAPACQGFPLCNGRILPAGAPGVHVHWTHRLAAYGLAAWALALPVWVRRRRPEDAPARRWAWIVTGLTVGQVAVGAALVLSHLPEALQAAHLAVGTALWAALVVLAVRLGRRPADAWTGPAAGTEAAPAASAEGRAAAEEERA